jgi:transcriptional regulator with XRE-family HTH domain
MIDLLAVGKKINALRGQKHLSQDQLADLLLVSRQAISAWETGKAAPSIDNVIELSKVFGVSFEEVLCLNDKPQLDPNDPFSGHDRDYILRSVIDGSLSVDFSALLFHSTGSERLRLFKAAQEGKIALPLNELRNQMTPEEICFFEKGGKIR